MLLCALAFACGGDGGTEQQLPSGIERLSARPQNPTLPLAAGTYQLPVASAPACCWLLIPQAVSANQPLALMVMLHGANGTPEAVDEILALGEEYGYAVLAPRSTGKTWDAAINGFGPDVPLIDAALVETFKRVKIDPTRVALAGFSDGASYALSLGLANGDLFTHIIAFSPGFMSPVPRVGKPLFFIAHGAQDGVTSARVTREIFVPFLTTLGYTVQFESFEGGHRVDDAKARLASHWLLGK